MRLSSSRVYLFGYFAILMVVGGILLWLLPTWAGDGKLSFLDALFTAVSAVAVTGLITVNTASYAPIGQAIILVLIQLGGLGVIAFSTLYLTQPRRRISLQRRAMIREYFIGSLEYEPRTIVRKIVMSTLGIELVLAVVLAIGFACTGTDRVLFTAVFHAVSAFCNAGFSTFANSLESFAAMPGVVVPIMIGFVVGGLGFVVYQDCYRRIRRQRHVLSLHTKIVLAGTAGFIMFGCLFFLIFERSSLSAVPDGGRFLAALFQSVTPRTAGFDTLPQSSLSGPGAVLTMVLMFTGGAPGSIAGGVKVTTVIIIVMAAIGATDEAGDMRLFRRKLPSQTVSRALLFVARALLIVVTSFLLLTVTELVLAGHAFSFRQLSFETLSAFGTVGLSMGITEALSGPGKVVVMLTMFGGRVGIISLALPIRGRRWNNLIDYPSGEVLIG
jgi:trk system potassium uptake protein TrkH